ncbi:MAG: PmoA family protein [Phycisphaerales bacterium]|nr:MAG: PmoA family protein [Phycisphaerales bacterium]
MKSEIRSAWVAFLGTVFVLCGVVSGAETIARLKVVAPKDDRVIVPIDNVLGVRKQEVYFADVPVHGVVELPKRLAGAPLEEIRVKTTPVWSATFRQTISVPGQLVRNDEGKTEVWWVVPRLGAGGRLPWTVGVPVKGRPNPDFGPVGSFSWRDKAGEYLDLLFDGKKVTRYIYGYDTSTEQRTFETYKPFHHVFDANGNRLTNGPDGVSSYTKKGIRYPHHRGIMIGWNRLMFEGRRHDLWHMREVHQVHQKFEELTAGPVMARSTALVHWNAEDGKPLLVEYRRTTVYRQSAPTVLMLDFVTELRAVRGDVLLDGDPEHAGVQYRAHNDVAAGAKERKATYLFHADGIDPRKDRDLPWVAMSYGLKSGRYVVQHMNHPDNPKPTICSAYRDYGRFGAFFKKEIGRDTSLTLKYRIVVSRGDMPDRETLEERYIVFADEPKVEVLTLGGR